MTFISFNFGIFWDNVTFISDMGNALYENGVFNWMSITPEIDPGHPPFTAFLVASAWTFFGKSLWITHLMMFPFIYGFLVQLSKFVEFFVVDKTLKIWAFLLVLIDPTLLAQMVSVNPEMPLLFFFFLALNGILYKNLFYKSIGLIFIGIISYRGMMLGVGIFLIDVVLHVYYRREALARFFNLKHVIIYSLSAIPAVTYITWRLVYKGWLITNPVQPWGDAIDYSDKSGFLLNLFRNFAVLFHRYMDFGRIFVFLVILWICLFYRKQILFSKIKPLLIIAVFSVIVIVFTSLAINNPMGHRYFIMSYLCFALLGFVLIKQLLNTHTHIAKLLFSILVVGLLSGNFWIYPDKISQGWDASLAHLHYFKLRQKAITYLEKNNINIQETASFFPNNKSIDVVDLNGDKRSFKDFTGSEPYIMYSNVYNIKDSEYDYIHSNYILLKSFSQLGVRVELWAKK